MTRRMLMILVAIGSAGTTPTARAEPPEQRENWDGETSRRVVAVGLVALGFAGNTSAAFGPEPELPAMRILVNTVPGVPIEVLLRANVEAARIYADAGVRLAWSDPSRTLPCLTVMIVSNPDAWLERVGANALGAAPGTDEGMGRLAYAFFDRIGATAQQYRTDVGKLLGYVMAHELGHILLAGGSHSPSGIMSNRWGHSKMDLVAESLLRFTKEQVESIRKSVGDMKANHR